MSERKRMPTLKEVDAGFRTLHRGLWTGLLALFLTMFVFASFKPGSPDADWNFRAIVVLALALIVTRPSPKPPE